MSRVFTIHKYPLSIGVPTLVKLPVNSEILHLGQQDGNPMMWVRKDCTAVPLETRVRTFICLGTGWSMAEQEGLFHAHIGTVQIGKFVCHFFEEVEVAAMAAALQARAAH
jgi:hypothetical protein